MISNDLNRFSLLALAALLCACGAESKSPSDPSDPSVYPPPSEPSSTSSGMVVRSSKPRNTSPNVSDPALRALVEGNNGFALSLYEELATGSEKNVFISPHSISAALAMTYAGARGETARQMAQTLRFGLGQDELHPAFNALDLALKSRGQGAMSADGKRFRLNIVNAIWGQKGYSFATDYLDTLAVNYDAGLRVLNFKDQPDASRLTINDWVAQQTEGKIPELLGPGTIANLTRLVLTNAIYFNAAWAKVFPAENSHDGAFTRLDGTELTVPKMSHADTYPRASGNGWQAVELPYDGEELGMLVILPDAGRFADVEASLDASTVASIAARLAPENLALIMPKWKTGSKFQLKEQLMALGMTDAFSGRYANFTGINGGIEPLWIDQVIHQTEITVAEQGTEAAAATAVVMISGVMMVDNFDVDRPFIYAIRDRQTGAILFIGRMLDPLAS